MVRCEPYGSPPLLRTVWLPPSLLFRSSHWQPLPSQPEDPPPAFTNFTRCQFHSCPYLIPPDSIHHQGISPPDSRICRSPTRDITVKTSNYTRNTYIYYYIYLEKHHISEYTHIIAIYTNLPFLHFFPIFSLYQKTQNWRFLSDSKKHTFSKIIIIFLYGVFGGQYKKGEF